MQTVFQRQPNDGPSIKVKLDQHSKFYKTSTQRNVTSDISNKSGSFEIPDEAEQVENVLKEQVPFHNKKQMDTGSRFDSKNNSSVSYFNSTQKSSTNSANHSISKLIQEKNPKQQQAKRQAKFNHFIISDFIQKKDNREEKSISKFQIRKKSSQQQQISKQLTDINLDDTHQMNFNNSVEKPKNNLSSQSSTLNMILNNGLAHLTAQRKVSDLLWDGEMELQFTTEEDIQDINVQMFQNSLYNTSHFYGKKSINKKIRNGPLEQSVDEKPQILHSYQTQNHKGIDSINKKIMTMVSEESGPKESQAVEDESGDQVYFKKQQPLSTIKQKFKNLNNQSVIKGRNLFEIKSNKMDPLIINETPTKNSSSMIKQIKFTGGMNQAQYQKETGAHPYLKTKQEEDVFGDEWIVKDFEVNQIFANSFLEQKIKGIQRKSGAFQQYNQDKYLPQKQSTLKPKRGWLLKYSQKSLFVNWKPKFAILEEKRFKYYKDETLEKLQGCISFDHLKYLIRIQDQPKTRHFKIEIYGRDGQKMKVFYFDTSSQIEKKQWIDLINNHYQTALSSNGGYSQSIINENKFWKTNFIDIKQFEDNVDTGDILLFQTKALGSKFQRVFTGSSYDHIAILLRYSNGKIIIFECLRDTGVSVCEWTKFLTKKWFNLYSKVVYRKLHYQKGNDFVKNLEEFVRETVGKPFKISISKLLRTRNDESTMIMNNTSTNSDNNYFCSELVATAYQRLGLLDNERSASSYWPGSFSTENLRKQANLEGGAKLGEESQIYFLD